MATDVAPALARFVELEEVSVLNDEYMPDTYSSSVLSRDGQICAIENRETTEIELVRTRDGAVLSVLPYEKSVFKLLFNAEASLLASLVDGVVKIWSVPAGRVKRELNSQDSDIRDLVFSPDGMSLASVDESGTVILWDLRDGEVVWTFKWPAADSFSMSPDTETFAVSGGWSRDEFTDLFVFDGEREVGSLGRVSGGNAIFSPNGQLLVTSDRDEVFLWRVDSRTLVRGFKTRFQRIESLAFTPDGKLLAAKGRGSDDVEMLWRIDDLYGRIDLASYLTKGWFHLDGRKIAWRSKGENLHRSWAAGYLNVFLHSHVGTLRNSELTPAERDKTLFWQYYHAANWNSCIVMLPQLDPPHEQIARIALGKKLLANASAALENNQFSLARWRLTQLRNLETDQSADEFKQLLAKAKELDQQITEAEKLFEKARAAEAAPAVEPAPSTDPELAPAVEPVPSVDPERPVKPGPEVPREKSTIDNDSST